MHFYVQYLGSFLLNIMLSFGDIKENVMNYLQKNQDSPDHPDSESGAPSFINSSSSPSSSKESITMPVGKGI